MQAWLTLLGIYLSDFFNLSFHLPRLSALTLAVDGFHF